jgi:sortase (surface protein transpeptidase)
MKRNMRIAAGAVMVLAALIFAAVLTFALLYNPQIEVPVSDFSSVNPLSPADLPETIAIPSITMKASVEHAGVLADGRMAAPKKFADAAWYKYGTAPGMAGSAVIAGHLDNGLGLKGAFFNLSKLKPGDDIEVTTAGGASVHFTVERSAEYPLAEIPEDIFTKKDGAYLNLITCAGKWIYSPKIGMTYDKRLVVYAVKK